MAENVTNLNESVPGDAELRRTGFSAVADTSDRATVLKLQGELDVATAPALEEAVAMAFAAHPSSLVVDLTDLSFLDSTGIRVLVSAGRRADESSCSLVLLAPTPQVLRVLRLTGVDRLLAIEP
jgi:anti-sigma B factor antagonist